MGQPVVHFEITGQDPEKLRSYRGDLFGWEFDTSAPVAEAISQSGTTGSWIATPPHILVDTLRLLVANRRIG